MSISAFAPTAYGESAATKDSSAVALPGGGGTALLVSNLGSYPAVVLLGDSNVSVTPSTGIAVLAYQQLALTVGSATHLAAQALGGTEAFTVLNLAQGT